MTVRLTIRIPQEAAEKARTAVRAGQARSVSAYIAAAVGELEHPLRAELLGRPAFNAERTSQEVAQLKAWAEAELAALDPPQA